MMTRRRLFVVLVVLVLLGGCSPAETPETATTADAELESLRQRAEQGDAGAQFGLGAEYWIGGSVPQDYVEAVTCHTRTVFPIQDSSSPTQEKVRFAYMNSAPVAAPLHKELHGTPLSCL
jgi:hypothetical protein